MSDSAPPPQCGFETWFDPSPASSSSRPRYRVYPRVVAVMSVVVARAAALHRHSKPLMAILPRQIHLYAVADQLLFAALQPVNPLFSCLVGAAAVGSMRWGSVTFAEMERLGRLFRCRLEATSSSLWMMSGILAMLKRHCFNPSTPGLFNTAIASASLAFSGACGGVRVGVPSLYTSGVSPDAFVGPDSGAAETRTHSHPGSVTSLFDEPLLNSVAAQVTEASFVSSSLAVSKALSSRSGSKPLAMSSSASRRSFWLPSRPALRSGRRFASSSRSGGRKGGKGSAPSLKPLGFRKWEPSPSLTLFGGFLPLHWQAWRDRGAVPWVVDVLRVGYRIPFLRPPPLSTELVPMPSYAPTSIKGAALGVVTLPLIATGAVELAPLPSPGFSSRRFLVWKTLGSWRLVIDLSLLTLCVDIFPLSPGAPPVCCHVSPSGGLDSLRRSSGGVSSGSCAFESRHFLRFVAHGRTYRSMRCASVCPRPRRSSLGYGSCIRSSFLGYPVCVVTGRLARPWRPSSGISELSCPFVASWG